MQTALIGDEGRHFTDEHQVLPKFKQLNWPELMLPIKFHQSKMCQLAPTGDA